MTDLTHLRAVVDATPAGKLVGLTRAEVARFVPTKEIRLTPYGNWTMKRPNHPGLPMKWRIRVVRVIPDDWQTQCDQWAANRSGLQGHLTRYREQRADYDRMVYGIRHRPDIKPAKIRHPWPSGWFKHWT